MGKIKEYKVIIILVLIIISGAFYWYEYKPTKIKERCSAEAHLDRRAVRISNEKLRQEFVDRYYNDCLMRFGLK